VTFGSVVAARAMAAVRVVGSSGKNGAKLQGFVSREARKPTSGIHEPRDFAPIQGPGTYPRR